MYIYMHIIPGKWSASWHLVAVVLGSKTTQRGKNTTQNCKSQPKNKGKIRLNGMCYFLVAIVFEFFFLVLYTHKLVNCHFWYVGVPFFLVFRCRNLTLS